MPNGEVAQQKAGPLTFLAIVGLGAWIIGVLGSLRLQLVSKLVGDTFVLGYSPTKSLGFFCLALLVFCSRLLPLSSPSSSPSRSSSRLPAMVTVGLLSCLTISLVEHCLYCYAVDIPLTRASRLCVDGQYSFHALLHFHTSKIPIAWLTGYDGESLDSGGPYLALFADWLAALHLLILVAAVIPLLLILRRWSFELPPGYFLTTLIASGAVYKCLIDGGPMEGEFLVSLSPLLYALWGRRVVLACLPLQLFLLWVRFTLPANPQLTVEFFHMTTLLMVLGLPALVQSLWPRGRGMAIFSGILGLLLLGWVLQREAKAMDRPFEVPKAINLFRYGNTVLEPGTTFGLLVPFELPPIHPAFELEKSERGVRLYFYEARVTRRTTVFEICEQTGANLIRKSVILNKNPVQTRVQGVLFDDWPDDWPKSEMVLSYQCRPTGDRTVELEINFRPGSNLSVFRDALPGGIFLIVDLQPGTNQGDGWLKPGMTRPPLPRGHLRWLPGLRADP